MSRDDKKGSLGYFKTKRFLWPLSAIFSFLLGGLLLASYGWFKDYQEIPADHLIGNKAANVSRLKENGFPFSFLVIGDTHNSRTGETLLKLGLENSKPSFIIILGDVVNRPGLWDHRFFIWQMAVKVKPTVPIFLVPGNHDIDYTGTKIKGGEWRVTPEVYVSLYGARNFSFVFNDCLFILCAVESIKEPSYLVYLQETLSKKAEGKRHIFVFIHHPPKGAGMAGSFFLPNENEFFSLLESYRVTSCYFGDYHSYWRTQRQGVNLVISGGGGGRLKKSQPLWGKFHHILKVGVDRSIISENLIVLDKRAGFGHSLEKGVFLYLVPSVQRSVWVLPILAILLLSWGICSVVLFFCALKRPKQVGEGVSRKE